jgi:hypothetical protein
VAVDVRVGMDFEGPAKAYERASIERFSWHRGEASGEVRGGAAADPTGFVTAGPGLTILTYVTIPFSIAFDDVARFVDYLDHEGLDAVATKLRGQASIETPIRERYSRSAKSLLLAGPIDPAARDRALGLPLELVLLTPVGEWSKGVVQVELRYQGTPLADALVKLFAKGRKGAAATARTDPAGRAAIRLSGPGPFLLSAVHMVPSPDEAARWRSFWASITFEVPSQER